MTVQPTLKSSRTDTVIKTFSAQTLESGPFLLLLPIIKKQHTMKALEILDETLFIHDTNKGVTKQTKTYRLENEKFQISYENSNGSPMGFNSKMCLRQYSKEKATWNTLEDISVLNMSIRIPSYYSSDSKKHCTEFFQKMEERLVKIYS